MFYCPICLLTQLTRGVQASSAASSALVGSPGGSISPQQSTYGFCDELGLFAFETWGERGTSDISIVPAVL